MMSLRYRLLAAAGLAAAGSASAQVSTGAVDPLVAGFRSPPDAARPRVWWHWLSGNVDKEGIRLDMEWMQRIGLRGLQMFDGDMGAPQIVPHRVAAMSPEWLDDLRFAASEAKRLGLELGMAAGPGWSETGGPWVKPDDAMKKIVWSEVEITAGKATAALLPMPPANPGPFQDVPKERSEWGPSKPVADFYRDIAVLAWPLPDGDVPLSALDHRTTSSAGRFDLTALADGKLATAVSLPLPTAKTPLWIQTDFSVPQTIRALTYAGPLPGRFEEGPDATVEASEDGAKWRVIASFPRMAQTPAPQRTIAFPATRAKSFRVVFRSAPVGHAAESSLTISELAFVPGARVNGFEDKAGFGIMAEEVTLRTPAVGAAAIPASSIINLTAKMRPDGTLDWSPPAGRWAVMRFGWSLTGVTNHPATPEATGLEVDKLDAGRVRRHLDAYLQPVLDRLGPLAGQKSGGLSALITDSWEAGTQTWTESLPVEFSARRGYDLTAWLPAVAGHVIDSGPDSDKFLWDFRRTLADLLAEKHYGTITAFAREKGLAYYGEAVGASWPTIADGMQAKQLTDIPTGEFWAMPFGGSPAAYQGVTSDEFPADIAETASTAHIYGKPIVAAEALTSSQPLFSATPWALKWVADRYMAAGVNRLLIHTSPHQPSGTRRPGLTLGPFGQAFTRNETWADMAGPWIDYLSRSSFLLQQGKPVADILYFYGEGAPSGVPYREAALPPVPQGYAADYINAEAILNELHVEGGHIVTRGGASYRLLVLPVGLDTMTAPLARKLLQLVEQGAVLVGPKPSGSPSRSSDDAEVRSIANRLWRGVDGRLTTAATVGLGRIFWGRPLPVILRDLSIQPDFALPRSSIPGEILYARRHVPGGDLYFVSNQTDRRQRVDARLRVAGKSAEFWTPDDGGISAAPYLSDGETTLVPLDLAPYEARFVVLRAPAKAPSRAIAEGASRLLLAFDKAWSVRFPVGAGAPLMTKMTTLRPLNESGDPGLRFFSGIATYEQRIVLRAEVAARPRITLDLGDVAGVARVRVNGVPAGIAWKPPYRVDVTGKLRAGANLVEIEVANSWRNRLIGDAQKGQAAHYAFTSQPPGGGSFGKLGGPITADSPLERSGLIGPVSLRAIGGEPIIRSERNAR